MKDLGYPCFGRIFSLFIFLFFFLITVQGCITEKAEWKGTIEEEDGVTIVKNPKEPLYGEDAFSLEEDLSIGGEEGHADYMFSVPTSLAVDDNENIYVMDIQQKNIRIFDKSGKYLKTIGRKGQGPGELEMPTHIQITSRNELMVYDVRRRSLCFFSLDGKFLRTTPLIKMPFAAKISIDSKGDFIGHFGLVEEKRPVRALIKFSSSREKRFTFAKLEPYNSDPFRPGGVIVLRPDLHFCLTKEDNIIWALSSEYELHIVNSEGELIRKIVKDYNPVEITEEDKEKIIKERYLRRTAPSDMKAEFPKYFYPLDGIHVDDEGRVFVRTFDKAQDEKSYYYDVFDAEGRYIAKIPLKPMPRTPLAWKKNKLYTIEEEEEGYWVVKRYRLHWSI